MPLGGIVVDDIGLMLSLAREGVGLAYVPDEAIERDLAKRPPPNACSNPFSRRALDFTSIPCTHARAAEAPRAHRHGREAPHLRRCGAQEW